MKGKLIRHKINSGEPLFSQPGHIIEHKSPIVSLSFDKESNEGQIGLMNGSCRYINFDQGSSANQYPLFLTGGNDGQIKLSTSKKCDQIFELTPDGYEITAIITHSSLRLAAIATQKGNVFLFDVKTLSLVGSVKPFENGHATCGEFSQDGKRLILAWTGGVKEILVPEWTEKPVLKVRNVFDTEYKVQSV